MNKILKIIFGIYFIGLHIVILVLVQKTTVNSPQKKEVPVPIQTQKSQIPEEPKIKVSSVYILPHPPDFMEGRSLRFNSYKVITEDGKKKVIFSEIVNGLTIQTKVDSEAIKWR